MRLEWYMKSDNIKSTSNYKIIIDPLMDAKVYWMKNKQKYGRKPKIETNNNNKTISKTLNKSNQKNKKKEKNNL